MTDSTVPATIAVIGSGPRGVAVLERLAMRLRAEAGGHPVTIHVLDAVEVGAGRIWRTDQEDHFTMNTVTEQVTMFSGPPDSGPARPGAGPALDQWMASERLPASEPVGPGADRFASRLTYGHYLRFVYRSIADRLPAHVRLVSQCTTVTSLDPLPEGGYRLALGAARELYADSVLLATGHPRLAPDEEEQHLLDFASRHPGARYLRGDSAADMELAEAVPPGTTVAVKGMGLSFYDVMLSLTVARGGVFERDGGGTMTYRPSGAEPMLVAGSRSGLPIPARGRNQKPPKHAHRPVFMTPERVRAAQERRRERTGSAQLDFGEDIRPWVDLEVDHVHLTTHVRARSGEGAAERFSRAYVRAVLAGEDVGPLLREVGVDDVPPLDMERRARPFEGEEYTGPDQWRDRLLAEVRSDLAEAELGNVDGPLKAALDVLRDIRGVLRPGIDFAGLTPESYREAFLGRYVPANALLSAGPPIPRVEQLVALVEAGLLEVAGPDTRFGTDEARGRFTVESPRVPGSRRLAEVLVDARIPSPRLGRDASALFRHLRARGMVRESVVPGVGGELDHRAGGLDVDPESYRVVDARGTARGGLYALGIPTEHTRWFTQVGSSRPGHRTLFHQDADTVARGLLADALGRRGRPVASRLSGVPA